MRNLAANQLKEDLIATLRGLAASSFLHVEFGENLATNPRGDFFVWDENFFLKSGKIFLPKLDVKNLKSSRAALDMAASYILFHRYLQNEEEIFGAEKEFLAAFEKVRVLVCISEIYFGSAKNLLLELESSASDSFIISEKDALSLLFLEEFFADLLGKKTKKIAAQAKENLSKKIFAQVKNLREKIYDQAAFKQAVRDLFAALEDEKNHAKEDEKEQKKSTAKNENQQSDLENFGAEKVDSLAGEAEEKNAPSLDFEEQEAVAQNSLSAEILLANDEEKKGANAARLDKSSFGEDEISFKNPYKIFTTQFDEVVFPQKFLAKSELEILRDQLDLRLAKLSKASSKMTLQLKKKLLSKQNSFLEFDSSRGVLDRKKLASAIFKPLGEEIFINQKLHDYNDAALTILLDNSGSMRGQPIVMAALACDIIASILEKFRIKTEIIGFTTADWKGGRARKMWESSGRQKNPGRLNELRHIIYKHFNQSFKKARSNLGLMLKEGILKENIDGEALLFARSRLMQQREKRKILIVISDGTPVDDSTASSNDSEILCDHLRYVINKIEKLRKLEIVGIGIGHATDEFYRNSLVIKNVEELGDAMIKKIAALL